MQGCTYVVQSFMEYSVNRSKVIWSLVEAIGECINIIFVTICVFKFCCPCFKNHETNIGFTEDIFQSIERASKRKHAKKWFIFDLTDKKRTELLTSGVMKLYKTLY